MLYSKSLKRATARKAASLYTSKSKRRKCTIPKENRRANKWVSHSFVIAGLVHAMLTHSARCTLALAAYKTTMGGGCGGVRAYFIHNHVAGLAGWLGWRAPFFATVNNPI